MSDHAPDSASDQFWKPAVVYGMAAVCMGLGLAAGYLLRGSGSQVGASATPKPVAAANTTLSSPMPTLEQMKEMADKKVEPLREQLQKDPKNKDVLLRIAYFYKSAHQFKPAANYFKEVLELDPKNVAVRTEMASCLYYDGDVDGALAQLEQSVKQNPKDANSLFNLGVIRWKGKNDAPGAIHAWQQLLESNPNLEKKPIVERMIAEARQQANVR